MATEYDYWLSFVIKQELGRDGRKYGERYQTLVAAIEDVSFPYWKETTSFYLLRTSLTIDELAKHVRPAIDATKDTIIVRVLGHPTARIIGVYHDPTLTTFLPYLRQG